MTQAKGSTTHLICTHWRPSLWIGSHLLVWVFQTSPQKVPAARRAGPLAPLPPSSGAICMSRISSRDGVSAHSTTRGGGHYVYLHPAPAPSSDACKQASRPSICFSPFSSPGPPSASHTSTAHDPAHHTSSRRPTPVTPRPAHGCAFSSAVLGLAGAIGCRSIEAPSCSGARRGQARAAPFVTRFHAFWSHMRSCVHMSARALDEAVCGGVQAGGSIGVLVENASQQAGKVQGEDQDLRASRAQPTQPQALLRHGPTPAAGPPARPPAGPPARRGWPWSR